MGVCEFILGLQCIFGFTISSGVQGAALLFSIVAILASVYLLNALTRFDEGLKSASARLGSWCIVIALCHCRTRHICGPPLR